MRRELLDHVVAFNERHLRRLLGDYVAYHHDDRTHLGLGKATPAGRPVERRPAERLRLSLCHASAGSTTATSGARRRNARPERCDCARPRPDVFLCRPYTQNEGMGLGLYLSSVLAARMDGTLQVERVEEGGTRVTLILPRKERH